MTVFLFLCVFVLVVQQISAINLIGYLLGFVGGGTPRPPWSSTSGQQASAAQSNINVDAVSGPNNKDAQAVVKSNVSSTSTGTANAGSNINTTAVNNEPGGTATAVSDGTSQATSTGSQAANSNTNTRATAINNDGPAVAVSRSTSTSVSS